MILRISLLVLGLLAVVTGAVLSLVATGPLSRRAAPPEVAVLRHEILTAARPIETGTLLRLDDMTWQPAATGAVVPGTLRRGDADMDAFVGALARRDFSAGEPLFASWLVRPGDRGFLAAVLAPGNRAVSVPVDAPQTAAGLMRPGDHVDVILTQTFNDAATDQAHRSVGETILRDLRVIAVDQRVSPAAPVAVTDQRGVAAEPHAPKTVTLEVTPDQAQALFVATQLGRIELALRSLATASDPSLRPPPSGAVPTWAADVSPALRAPRASSPRPAAVAEPERPKVEVMHGAKTELR